MSLPITRYLNVRTGEVFDVLGQTSTGTVVQSPADQKTSIVSAREVRDAVEACRWVRLDGPELRA